MISAVWASVVVDRHGQRRRLILRRWTRPGWEVDDPDVTAAREVTILGLLACQPTTQSS
jgi:hypothetical protein